MDLKTEFRLSLYEELKLIHKSSKVEIYLVQNNHDEKFYIKKQIREYTKEVYKNIKNIESINTPRIYEIFEVEDKLIIIEEFINGYTLQEILEREGVLDEKKVINYMISLCDILNKIHTIAPPIIHRDIKPANIIISNDDVLKLIDFDISRTYKYGENIDTTLLGTKGYASPEQFGFDQTDCRSDIYAMGIMMNVLTTGKHVKEELNNTLLKDIIIKSTNISADKRYQDVLEVKKELEEILIDKKIIIKEKTTINKNKKTRLISSIFNELPGFRRKKLIYMICASIWYMFLITGLFIATTFIEFIENIILILTLLLTFLIFTNFLNIKERLPIIRSKKKTISIFGYSLYTMGIFLSGGGLLTLFS